MARPNSEGMEVELAVVDFVDAYQTIGVHPDEQRRRVVAAFDGACFIMRFVAFGGAGSPLILGQSSSVPGSIGTVHVLPEARMEIYVDHPFVAVLGTPTQRSRRLTVLMLWRLSLGPELSWAKAQKSSRVNWVGAEVVVDSPNSLTVYLPAEFVSKLLDNIDTVMGVKGWTGCTSSVTGTTEFTALRLLAVRVSAGIVPCFGTMLELVWAVLTEYMSPRKHPPEARIPRRRTTQACSWLVNVLRRQTGAGERTYEMDTNFSEPTFVTTVDASPWGVGGFLSFKGRAIGWFAEPVQEQDVQRFGIEIGSHKFQTLLEALAVLVAVRCWSAVWNCSRASPRVRSDSLSTLGAMNKLRSRTPGLAAIMWELAFRSSSWRSHNATRQRGSPHGGSSQERSTRQPDRRDKSNGANDHRPKRKSSALGLHVGTGRVLLREGSAGTFLARRGPKS